MAGKSELSQDDRPYVWMNVLFIRAIKWNDSLLRLISDNCNQRVENIIIDLHYIIAARSYIRNGLYIIHFSTFLLLLYWKGIDLSPLHWRPKIESIFENVNVLGSDW